ncbi:MAG: glycosyltransferase [Candidatus Ancaeobacter aquaticus]|nr:glycosyltransferase [Candidatus Ancaeobacter aquaticus]
MYEKKDIIKFYNAFARDREFWRVKNKYYHQELNRLVSFLVPQKSSVVEIGCSDGELLDTLKPVEGVGVDFSENMLECAKKKYPNYTFELQDAEDIKLERKFDYIVMSDLVGELNDVWKAFRELKKITHSRSRVVVTYHNFLWEPFLKLAERLKLKIPQMNQNWLSLKDLRDLLDLNGYEVIKEGYHLLFPKHIPILSAFMNKFIAKLPFIKKLCLIIYLVAREKENEGVENTKEFSCSIIIPTKNEAGNIEGAVERVPNIGKSFELIFVDGNSTDGTVEKINDMKEKYKDKKDISLIHQGDGKGKGDAVRKGFAAAKGDVLMILDSDLTVPPEELPQFYCALSEGRGDFINGCRLVYQMESQAMRFLNLLGNKFFGMLFSWILEQPIKDTLCGTKVLFKSDYERIVAGRDYFGDFDPFGDFDLLFGASKLNMKIVEMPVHYKDRVYGDIKIRRFFHGWLLLRMSGLAFLKLKMFS